jgi:ketosteroid isomerase-like protein
MVALRASAGVVDTGLMTPEDDVAAARRSFEFFNQIGANLEADPEADLDLDQGDVFVDEPEIVPFRAALESTMYSGPNAVDDFWEASRESWSKLQLEIDRVEAAGVGVIAVGTLTGTSREGGAPVESKLAFAFRVRDGRVARLATHLSEESALRELGAE